MWRTLCCCHRLKSGLPAAVCARTGAVLGRATRAQEAALGDYFLAMGLAFQILDDVINLQGFGNSLKTKAEDLIEGKITAPVIRCLMAHKRLRRRSSSGCGRSTRCRRRSATSRGWSS